MDQDDRPSPEQMLEAVKLEEAQRYKGSLKIYLGMAAGVGKTFAMLEEAQILRRSGVDIVVGIVETHGRADTEMLLKDLILLPRKTIVYKDKEFEELDVDAIIALHPSIVLVDEFAHNNTPGSKHAKRWQDVLEILDNGIDVYTTLNVQHIESLNDIVRGITEIVVRETVPDVLIERANSIQLVDLTPEELLQRLKDGKVYFEEQSRVAVEHFFQKNKLTALREIVLRYVADKIDTDLRRMVPIKEGHVEWKTREKFLVAISHSPHTQKLIRTTRRLAAQMNSPWIAVHVDTGATLEPEDSEQLAKNLALTRDLGAEIVTVFDPDIVEGIKRVAYQRGVTQIIMGRTPRNPFFEIFQGPTFLDKLALECKDVDIHVIRQERYHAAYKKRKFSLWPQSSDILAYFYTALTILLLTFLNFLALPLIGYKIVGAFFLIGIILLIPFFKKGPILLAVLLYAVLWNYFFIPPIGEFTINSGEDVALFIIYISILAVVGIVADRAREQRDLLIKSERTSFAFADIVRCINSNLEREAIFHYVEERLSKTVAGTFEIAAKSVNNSLDPDSIKRLAGNDKEKTTALWAFENGKEAGWSTETLPLSENLYLPLKGVQEVAGLLVYRPHKKNNLSIEERNFLYSVCQQLSNYLERYFAFERTKQHDNLKLVEKIHKTILDRFSRSFEGPILKLKDAIAHLRELLKTHQDPSVNNEIHQIETSFDVFVKVLENMTAMTELSEGMVPLRKSLHPIKEVIDECCENAKRSSRGHRFEILVPNEMPSVPIDYYLIHILLHNLIINAMEHSPPGSTITIEASLSNGYMNISITDEGKGIPTDQLGVIFDKFYKPPEETKPGIGLGLAIAKTIAEVHQGTIKAENAPGKGARFTLSIPIEN